MGTLQTFLLILVSLLGSLALEDLEGKAFVFPAASKTAHVVVESTIRRPLTNFTLCMRFYTDLARGYSLFSYASKRDSNEILLFAEKPRQYSLYLRNQAVTFDVPEKLSTSSGGEHICVSWESATGLVEFWANGEPLVRKSLKKGHSVSPELCIVLGQEQDSPGGGFDINQCFLGEMWDVYMWGRVLPPDEVRRAYYNEDLPDHLIEWKALSYTSEGEVYVKEALSSSYRVPGEAPLKA